MTDRRVFDIAEFLQHSEDELIRSIVRESPHATIIAWTVAPGQRVPLHTHPRGQDTWTVISGEGDYQTDDAGGVQSIRAGHVVVATAGQAHGVLNSGKVPLVFVSVVCPLDAGYLALLAPTPMAVPFPSSSWLE